MNCALGLSLLLAVATTTTAEATCKGQESITVNTPVSVWEYTKSGQINDHFTLLESEGVQVGIRVQERGVPNPLTPTDTNNDSIGEYRVETGSATDGSDPTLSWWNFDWHVDVSNADDDTKQTIGDYSGAPGGGGIGLTVECVAGTGCAATTPPFGPYTMDLAPAAGPTAVPQGFGVYQGSQNPGFTFWPWSAVAPAGYGDGSYDIDIEATYKVCVILGDTFCPVCILVQAALASSAPSGVPSQVPSSSGAPSGVPSKAPSLNPPGVPSILPTLSGKPSMVSCCRAIWKYTCTFLMSII